MVFGFMNKIRDAQRVRDAYQEDVVGPPELLLAVRSGWRLILGLIFFAVAMSLIYVSHRIPLYEATATIRVGWVPFGSNILPIEPIKDLEIMLKGEHVLLSLFWEMRAPAEAGKISEFRDNLSVKARAPASNFVDFKFKSKSPDEARIWLDKLVSMIISEHAAVVDDFLLRYEQNMTERIKKIDSDKKLGENNRNTLTDTSRDGARSNYLTNRPFVQKTIIAESVKVNVARFFPSLQLLIVASILGGVIVGVAISHVVLRFKNRL